MSNPVTLNLPDDLYRQAETLAREYQLDYTVKSSFF